MLIADSQTPGTAWVLYAGSLGQVYTLICRRSSWPGEAGIDGIGGSVRGGVYNNCLSWIQSHHVTSATARGMAHTKGFTPENGKMAHN